MPQDSSILIFFKELVFFYFKYSAYGKEALDIASSFDSTNFKDDTRRQLKEVGTQPLPEDEEKELSKVDSEMGKIYGSTKVCIDGNEDGDQCYNLEPGLTDIMAESTNYTLRTLVWEVCIRVHPRLEQKFTH